MTICNRDGSVLLKAPEMSWARMVGRGGRGRPGMAFSFKAIEDGCRRLRRASIADLPGTAPNCEELRAPQRIEASAIRRAAIASSVLEMFGRRDMGRYDLARLGGREPFFGIITHFEIFHSSG